MSTNNDATMPPKDISDLHSLVGPGNLLQAITQHEQPWQSAPSAVTPTKAEHLNSVNGSPGASGLPPINDATDFLAIDWIKPTELIAGLLHEDSKCSVGGPSKGPKSAATFSIHLSRHRENGSRRLSKRRSRSTRTAYDSVGKF